MAVWEHGAYAGGTYPNTTRGKRIGGRNCFEVPHPKGAILVSYATPVAAVVDGVFYKTRARFSVTTSKQISQWRPSVPYGVYAGEMSQSYFNDLYKEVGGGTDHEGTKSYALNA